MGGPRDHDDIDVLPQHPGRAMWAHEGLEEFQGFFLESAESLRLLEERSLREDDDADSEGATGVPRWRPVQHRARLLGARRRCAVSSSMRRLGWALWASCSSPPASACNQSCRDPATPGVQGYPIIGVRENMPTLPPRSLATPPARHREALVTALATRAPRAGSWWGVSSGWGPHQ
jgi:hypothetical protein